MVHDASSVGYPVPVAGSLWSTTCGVNLEHQHDSCLAVHDIVKGHFGALAFWEVVGWCGNFVCTVGEVGWDGKLPLAGWVVVMFSLHPIRTTLPRQSRHVTLLSPNSVPPRAHVAHRSRTLEPSLGQLARSTHDNARRQLSRHSYRHSKAEAKAL